MSDEPHPVTAAAVPTTAALARAWAWFFLKVGVTTTLLVVVARRLEWDRLLASITRIGVAPIAGAVVLSFAAVFVSAVRWHRVLAHLGEKVSVLALFGDTLVGTAYNLILPTSVGGDVARAVRAGGRVTERERAWTSVLFERVMGLLSLVLVSCVGLVGSTSEALRKVFLVALFSTLVLIGFLLFAQRPFRLAARLAGRVSSGAAVAFERMAEGFGGPLARPRARLETLGWSLLYQLVALSVLLAAGWAWDEPELARAVYLGVPIALVLANFPGTIGGFGLRELLFVDVLAAFGLAKERALLLSMLWVASNLLVALAGGAVLLLERRARGDRTGAPASGADEPASE